MLFYKHWKGESVKLGLSTLPPSTPPSVDTRGPGRGTAAGSPYLEGAGGLPEIFGFFLHICTQTGGGGARCCPVTYIFVQELALVPVVQVNELGHALLLSVHQVPTYLLPVSA